MLATVGWEVLPPALQNACPELTPSCLAAATCRVTDDHGFITKQVSWLTRCRCFFLFILWPTMPSSVTSSSSLLQSSSSSSSSLPLHTHPRRQLLRRMQCAPPDGSSQLLTFSHILYFHIEWLFTAGQVALTSRPSELSKANPFPRPATRSLTLAQLTPWHPAAPCWHRRPAAPCCCRCRCASCPPLCPQGLE